MSSPRYRPRDFLTDPWTFGRVEGPSWRELLPGEERRTLHAARLQHAWALKIRRRLQEKKLKISTYAAMAGVEYDRLTKVLRGDVLMRLEDLADAEIHLQGVVAEASGPLGWIAK